MNHKMLGAQRKTGYALSVVGRVFRLLLIFQAIKDITEMAIPMIAPIAKYMAPKVVTSIDKGITAIAKMPVRKPAMKNTKPSTRMPLKEFWPACTFIPSTLCLCYFAIFIKEPFQC